MNNIDHIISANNCLVDQVNQTLHNHGIEFNERLNIVMELIDLKFYNAPFNSINHNPPLKNELLNIINPVTLSKYEIFQKVFMLYCNKSSKINLDQFYTPCTIGEFIAAICTPHKTMIDPACGTGDLCIHYEGNITLWDISPNVIDVCIHNFQLNNKTFHTKVHNTLAHPNLLNNSFDYCCLNPPFGSKTVIKNPDVLKHYQLAKNKTKEEIGILFIERAINLLKNNGIAFIILPNGYLGNTSKNTILLRNYFKQFHIVAILELPDNTFSRSGTGVNTSLLILKKTKPNQLPIYMRKINHIGYILNKKGTPYKYLRENGQYILHNNAPVLHNELPSAVLPIQKIISNSYTQDCINFIKPSLIQNNILDVKRYLPAYTNTILHANRNSWNHILSYIQPNPNSKFSPDPQKQYIYLDIKQINTPSYSTTNLLYGYELPNRAKIKLQQHDIIISKLKSNRLTFTIILENTDNLVCTNGFALLRPTSFDNAIIIFSNLFQDYFKIQHYSLSTGSIMATISENHIKNIFINPNINTDKYKQIYQALLTIHSALSD